jgi:hypothetical protein
MGLFFWHRANMTTCGHLPTCVNKSYREWIPKDSDFHIAT